MKNNNKTLFFSGGILAIAVMGANVVNFVFNAFLGRILSFEEFGLITFISSLLYIVSIFYNALSSTVNHYIAFAQNKEDENGKEQFLTYIVKKTFLFSISLMCLWLLLTPFIAKFFNVNNFFIIYLFSLIILFYPFVFINRGYLQGKFLFISLAFIVIAEPIIKLIFALIFVFIHNNSNVYLSLYISSLAIVVFSVLIVMVGKQKNEKYKKHLIHFPFKFYLGALITGLSTLSFLALDLIMVKHYLNPKLAGQYALLALIGKIIYFLGTLLNSFTITIVSNAEGQNKNPLVSFYKLLTGSFVLSGIGYVSLGLFGSFFTPILFGKKAILLFSYLNLYCLTILLFTLANIIVTFHLAKKQFIFPVISFITSIIMLYGISIFHQNLQEIIRLIFAISVFNFIALFLLHLQKRNFIKKIPLYKVLEKEIYD